MNGMIVVPSGYALSVELRLLHGLGPKKMLWFENENTGLRPEG